MNTQPLVSVVIIFLNAEKFLEEAIESVFAQSYQHWELLLVDDGSTDGSTPLALGYAERHPDCVRYLEHADHQNVGASASRNLGIGHARGEYLALMDADDVWLPHKLAEQVAIFLSQPAAGMVYGNALYWYSWTGELADLERDYTPVLGDQLDTLIAPPQLLYLFLQQKFHVPCPCTIMVRREVIARRGGFEEAFRGIFQLYEDQVFYAKVCFQEPVFVASACWAKYRRHPDSCVATVRAAGRQHAARYFYLDWLERYLAARGGRATAIWPTLQTQLRPYRHPILHYLEQRTRRIISQGQLGWLQISIASARLKRRMLRQSTGAIIASPNHVKTNGTAETGVTTLFWSSTGATALEVHVEAPDGPLFSRSGPTGSATTGAWVRDRMTFFLQDVSDDLPLTADHTLAVAVIRVQAAASLPHKGQPSWPLAARLRRKEERPDAG